MTRRKTVSKAKQHKITENIRCIIGIFVVGVLLTACNQNMNEIDVTEATDNTIVDNYENSLPDESACKVEISMEDAISLGMEEALNYYDNLYLTEVHSYDNDEYIDKDAGENGKRQWWYVNFANEEQNYVSILICDGAIDVVEHFDSNGNTGLINLSDISLTAEDAVSKAKEMGLTGGDPDNQKDWASGYNFKLSYGSLTKSSNDIRIFLEVIGISPNGNFAHIDFDASTGEVLLAEEKIEHSNGDIEWKEFEYEIATEMDIQSTPHNVEDDGTE